MKVIGERLGHDDMKTTSDTYAHVLPKMQRDAAEKIDGILLQNNIK